MNNIFKRFVFTFINEWRQFNGKYNWYNFTLINIDFEYDKIAEGVEINFVVLGIGVFVRYNLPASDKVFKKWEKEAKKVIKSNKQI